MSFICCQGRFQEGLRGPRVALAVCEALVKWECEERNKGERVAGPVGLREETVRRSGEEWKEGGGVPALLEAGMPLSYHLSSKKIEIMRLPGFARLQTLGTTLKNFVLFSNHPLLFILFYLFYFLV